MLFRSEGGFEPSSCYRVAISAATFQTGPDATVTDSGPEQDFPDYTTWFTTDDGETQRLVDFTPPTVVPDSAFAVSSQDAGSSFMLVATSAYLTVDFTEALTDVDVDTLVTLTGGSAGTIVSEVSGTRITVTPAAALDFGTEFTLVVNPAAVADAAGNYLSTSFTTTFMTVYEDGDTPTVLHSTPESTDTTSLDGRMVLFMSERVSADGTASNADFSGGTEVPMTQSTWAGFQDGTGYDGVVVVENARVTFASFAGLAAGTAAHLTVAASSLADVAGRTLATAEIGRAHV